MSLEDECNFAFWPNREIFVCLEDRDDCRFYQKDLYVTYEGESYCLCVHPDRKKVIEKYADVV